MATFTMMLNELLGVDHPRDADPSLIGLDDYPIWDDGYRGELNHKIIMRFWNREIGFETPDMFVHHMRRLMGEIMPYYNELAKTTVMDFDPFETLNITSETDSENTSTTTTDAESETRTNTASESTEQSSSDQTSQSETASRNVNSDHPQTRLNEYEDYATSSAEAVSESASTSNGSSSGTQTATGTGHDTSTGKQTGEQSQHHRDQATQRGTQGNKSQLLQDYRDTILSVDVLILDELEVLFMGVWDTDQSYTRIESPFLYATPYWYTGL